MKAKHYVQGKKLLVLEEKELGKKRMDAYLKATQPAFEAAVARASALGPAATGVLAGPRVRA